MDPLPVANAAMTQFFRQWMETFAGYVREVDYASARPLFHPDVLAFGTHNDVISGVDKWVTTQWDNVWPKTADFRFVSEQASVLASPDGRMATVIAPWTSTGFDPDGEPFPRPGRATLDAGFVVAAINHPGDNGGDSSQRDSLSVLASRPTDIIRLLDFMLNGWRDKAVIDPAKIGFFGFSAGAFTGLVLAQGNRMSP